MEKDQLITGSVFGRLYRGIKYAEGVDLEKNIRDPKFRNYEDLEVILKEAFSIYSDFKKEVLKIYCLTNPLNATVNIESDIFEPESALEKKLTLFIKSLKDQSYPSYHYFEEIKLGLKENPTEFKQRLKSSFSITQYANFTSDLESQLTEIIELIQ